MPVRWSTTSSQTIAANINREGLTTSSVANLLGGGGEDGSDM